MCSVPRGRPLNTIALLRAASDELALGPADAMHHAERLYLAGILSYPRTETCRYAAAFDLPGTLGRLAAAESLPPAELVLQRGSALAAAAAGAAA